MNTCIRAFDKFILSTPNLRSKDSERERQKDEHRVKSSCSRNGQQHRSHKVVSDLR